MLGSKWVYVSVAALLCAHLAMLLYVYRSNRSESPLNPDRIEPDEPDDADRCRCPECGTVNERAYRFCRQCVTELPTTQLQIEHPSRQQQPY